MVLLLKCDLIWFYDMQIKFIRAVIACGYCYWITGTCHHHCMIPESGSKHFFMSGSKGSWNQLEQRQPLHHFFFYWLHWIHCSAAQNEGKRRWGRKKKAISFVSPDEVNSLIFSSILYVNLIPSHSLICVQDVLMKREEKNNVKMFF